MAATATPEATSAAMEVLAEGGNAIDAAAAAAWALCVCEPSGSGLGGHTVLLFRRWDGTVTVIDGHGRAPSAASLDTITRQQQRSGYRATTVPSTPAALGYAQKKFGKLPAARVFRPAVRLAEDGYAVSPLFRKQIGWTLESLRRSPAASRLLLRDGDPPNAGERFRQPALAGTLRRLAAYGTGDFYAGWIAKRIVEDMQKNGGLIAWQDLAEAAAPVEREPIWAEYRGHRVASVPAPGGGGRLCKALESLSCFWPDPRGDSIDYWYEAIAKAVHGALRKTEREPALGSERCGETTHLCVADSQGNIVALTQSIQSLFGAKVANAELGFFYNNYLCTCPRFPHESQLRGRCRPRSNVAPTILLKHGMPFLVAGAAGSRRIVSSLLQTISGVIDRGLEIRDAVAVPRIHALAGGRVWLESPAATERLLNRLSRLFTDTKIKPELSFKMGAVQAIQFGADGSVSGAADPRRDGIAAALAADGSWI